MKENCSTYVLIFYECLINANDPNIIVVDLTCGSRFWVVYISIIGAISKGVTQSRIYRVAVIYH